MVLRVCGWYIILRIVKRVFICWDGWILCFLWVLWFVGVLWVEGNKGIEGVGGFYGGCGVGEDVWFFEVWVWWGWGEVEKGEEVGMICVMREEMVELMIMIIVNMVMIGVMSI